MTVPIDLMNEERRRLYKFDGGRGAVLCSECRTIVVADLGHDTSVWDAPTRLRLPVVRGGRVYCSELHAWEHRSKKAAKRYARLFAERLAERGVDAFHGRDWDGVKDHRETPMCWYFWPSGAQVGATFRDSDEIGESCDIVRVQPETFRRVLKEFDCLSRRPSRKDISAAIRRAHAAWRQRVLRHFSVISGEVVGHLNHAMRSVPPDAYARTGGFVKVTLPARDLAKAIDEMRVLARLGPLNAF